MLDFGVSHAGVSHGAGVSVFALHRERCNYACSDVTENRHPGPPRHAGTTRRADTAGPTSSGTARPPARRRGPTGYSSPQTSCVLTVHAFGAPLGSLRTVVNPSASLGTTDWSSVCPAASAWLTPMPKTCWPPQSASSVLSLTCDALVDWTRCRLATALALTHTPYATTLQLTFVPPSRSMPHTSTDLRSLVIEISSSTTCSDSSQISPPADSSFFVPGQVTRACRVDVEFSSDCWVTYSKPGSHGPQMA